MIVRTDHEVSDETRTSTWMQLVAQSHVSFLPRLLRGFRFRDLEESRHYDGEAFFFGEPRSEL